MDKKTTAQLVFSNPLHWLSFGFGSGLAPKAPGTFGTLVALPVYWLFSSMAMPQYLAVLLIMTLVGIYLCGYTAKALGVHDHPGIVWDEIVGYMIAMAGFGASLTHMLLAFVLFRFFDIIKPWPIKVIDNKLHGGWGIMFDDMVAGAIAWACLYGIDKLWL